MNDATEDIATLAPAASLRTVLITGAAGFVGKQVVRALAVDDAVRVIATDLRPVSPRDRLEGVDYETLDICGDGMGALFRDFGVDTVVHLAAIVTPGPDTTREIQHRVDVDGTRAVLDACVEAGVGKLIYTSSGAAYGYHGDAPALLHEDDPLRGNEVFAYSSHKREVEEMLERYRDEHPELRQLVFRVSSVLGPDVDNQITAMFERPVVNLAGDGVMTLREIAREMDRPYVALPEMVVQGALRLLKRFDAAPYGPEQTLFLKHRPVLDNTRLKKVFGYRPSGTSREIFARYRDARVGSGAGSRGHA
jgi:UDP-glucose 4-epimerase